MNIIGYTEGGCIEVTIDGQTAFVPDDPTNRHRQMIAEWEAEGNAIPAYVPPPTPEPDPETLLREAMFEDFVERSAKNASTPKAIKDAALALKASRK